MRRTGLVLVFAVACGGAPPPVEPDIPPPQKPAPTPTVIEWSKLVGPVKSVDVHAADAALVTKVQDIMKPAIGHPIDRRDLRALLYTIYEQPDVADVTAKAQQFEDGVKLVLDIAPEPVLHALALHEVGGQDITLPAALGSAIGQPVDPELLDAVGGQLRDKYLEAGYADAAIAWKQTTIGSNAVDEAIDVTPGHASVITGVQFKGNAHARSADLVKALGDGFKASSPWNVDVIARGTLLLTSYYFDHGYVNVAVDEPQPPGAPGPVVYTITEGDQFRVGKIEVTNASPADAKKYLALVGVRQGQIFNRTAISDGLAKINKVLGQGMHAVPLTNIDAKKKLVDLKLDIQKG